MGTFLRFFALLLGFYIRSYLTTCLNLKGRKDTQPKRKMGKIEMTLKNYETIKLTIDKRN